MFIKFLAALILPGVLVVLFTRVTYSHILGLILTVALIAGSVYKGYTHTWLLIIVDAFSLTVGFAISRKMRDRVRSRA
ncbi:CsbA family protein [Cytobacillus sp. Hz8]|uniref:CsbA family protein n=1 Tax=Cytobacillus sp. Hz8 TaxID=3347168 RepID=UPI0035E02D99